MRQIVIPKYGNPNVFRIEDKPDLVPKENEVLINVETIGVNFADIMARKGLYQDAPKPPMVVGYEVSGKVGSIGEGVDQNWANKSVLALSRFNGYADQVCVPLGQVFEKPAALDFERAAAIPVNYLTAYQLLVVQGGLKENESVLIHNAGGGVGLAALDIAVELGAVSYGTASSHKAGFLKERGLNYFIDYRKQDWPKELMKYTHNQGVELVIDPIGGKHWKQGYKVLRATGRLGMFGASSLTGSSLPGILNVLSVLAQMPFFHPLSLMNRNKSVFGVNLGHMWHEPKKVGLWMHKILEGYKEGWVRPHVGKAFAMEEVAEAHDYIERRMNIGKVVLKTH